MSDPLLVGLMEPGWALLLGAGILAAGTWVCWPRRGPLSRWQHLRRTRARIRAEDALKHFCKLEMDRRQPTLASVAGSLQVSQNTAAQVIEDLQQAGLLQPHNGGSRLTPDGRRYALNIIRAHRVWERHLAEQTGIAEAEWHPQAERYEHLLTPEETNALAASLGHPTHDPHGDPIPTPDGEVRPHGGHPLSGMPAGATVRIVHLEDEPAALYAQIIAEELYPGQVLQVAEVAPNRIRFFADGEEHLLAPLVASNISVTPVRVEEAPITPAGPGLHTLEPGQEAVVKALSPLCRGAERRRLLDLGILPGTRIRAELRSPGGDPTAYRVRDSLIALRREQARLIHLDPESTAA